MGLLYPTSHSSTWLFSQSPLPGVVKGHWSLQLSRRLAWGFEQFLVSLCPVDVICGCCDVKRLGRLRWERAWDPVLLSLALFLRWLFSLHPLIFVPGNLVFCFLFYFFLLFNNHSKILCQCWDRSPECGVPTHGSTMLTKWCILSAVIKTVISIKCALWDNWPSSGIKQTVVKAKDTHHWGQLQ